MLTNFGKECDIYQKRILFLFLAKNIQMIFVLFGKKKSVEVYKEKGD
jgi:hypothetical protein